MNATIRYLDAARARAGLTSDYALAKRLGMPQSTISGYRTGRRYLDARAAFQVAEVAGVDVREVIAAVELDRAKSDQDRDFWRNVMAAAASILLGGFVGLQPAPANAFSGAAVDSSGYTLRNKRRRDGVLL
jgi:transcriptional regulator with XRE-family HTH domain